MFIQSPAIALQIRPWSKTSHMVTWLTPGYGKIVTSVKGACRPKSAFLGQYDLFYTCDLVIYQRDHDGVHVLRECVPIDLREPLRNKWRNAAAASYVADLTARVTPEHQTNEELFELFRQTLDRLAFSPDTPSLEHILNYEIHLLRQLGVQPDLTLCPECHPPDQRWLRFSLPSGKFLCRHTGSHSTNEATLTVPRSVQELFLLFDSESQHLSAPSAVNKIGTPSNLLFGLSRFLGMFMAFHLDVPSAVRRVALEMLNENHAQSSALWEINKT